MSYLKLLAVFIVLFASPLVHADKKRVTINRELVLRTIEGKLGEDPFVRVKELPLLPPGTVIRYDSTRVTDPHKYINENGEEVTSNSGWLYGFLIEELPKEVEISKEELKRINKMKLFTLYSNVKGKKVVLGSGTTSDGPITNMSGSLGKCARKIAPKVGASAVRKAVANYNKYKRRIKGNYVLIINYGKASGHRAFVVDKRRCRVIDSGHMAHGAGTSRRSNPKGRAPRYCGKQNETRAGAYLIAGLYRSQKGASRGWPNLVGRNNGIRLTGLTSQARAGVSRGIVAHGASYASGGGRSWGCFAAKASNWKTWYKKYLRPGSFLYAHAPNCNGGKY